jgi:hypothetical protein
MVVKDWGCFPDVQRSFDTDDVGNGMGGGNAFVGFEILPYVSDDRMILTWLGLECPGLVGNTKFVSYGLISLYVMMVGYSV